jgi:hypothetical protein
VDFQLGAKILLFLAEMLKGQSKMTGRGIFKGFNLD